MRQFSLPTVRMKLWSSLLVMSVTLLAIAVATPAEDSLWDEDLHDELLVRVSRGTKDRGMNILLLLLLHRIQRKRKSLLTLTN